MNFVKTGMKFISSFLLVVLFVSCANGKQTVYIGSTPAHPVVRNFLGLSLSDSVDFIKWKLVIKDSQYGLNCEYGLGKPNTDGFINGGKKIELTGKLIKEKNYYKLLYRDKTLMMLELNSNLVHVLNVDKSLLVGNGGWSYTLNIDSPRSTDQINIIPNRAILKDSMAFEGRTPCMKIADVQPGPGCIKLKWYVVFYADSKTKQPTTFRMNGTAYRREGAKTGTWIIITEKDGTAIYQLNPDRGNASLYLLKLDENILVFTDEEGELLVGDMNFSYTLNRRW